MNIKHFEANGKYVAVAVENDTLNHVIKFYKPYWGIRYEYPKVHSYTHGGFSLFFKDFGGRKKYPKEGSLKLIGLASDIEKDEALAKLIVESYNDNGLIKFKDYKKGYFTHSLFTPIDSFKSLMQANKIYTSNPWEIAYQFDQCRKWQVDEAQEHVANWLILKLEE